MHVQLTPQLEILYLLQLQLYFLQATIAYYVISLN